MNFIEGSAAAVFGSEAIGVRPEHLQFSKDTGTWSGVVTVAEHLGSDTFLHVNAEGVGHLTARASGEFDLRHGQAVFLTPEPDKIHRFDANGIVLS